MMLPAAKTTASSTVPIPHHEEGQFDDCDHDDDAAAAKTPPQLYQSKEEEQSASRDDLSSPSDQTEAGPPSVAESREDKDESSDGGQQHRTKQKISAQGITKADVLSGRGGGSNKHDGNRYFRQLCDARRHVYVMSKKMEKRNIAKEIVAEVRNRGGQFLKRADKTGEWEDIGEAKAVSKTSQALREGLAQKMRQALESSGTAERMRLEATAGGPPSHAAEQARTASMGRDPHPHVGHGDVSSPYIEPDHRYHQRSATMVSPDDRARKMPFSDHDAMKRQRFGF